MRTRSSWRDIGPDTLLCWHGRYLNSRVQTTCAHIDTWFTAMFHHAKNIKMLGALLQGRTADGKSRRNVCGKTPLKPVCKTPLFEITDFTRHAWYVCSWCNHGVRTGPRKSKSQSFARHVHDKITATLIICRAASNLTDLASAQLDINDLRGVTDLPSRYYVLSIYDRAACG